MKQSEPRIIPVSPMTTQLDLMHIQRVESELFTLIEAQAKELLEGKYYNAQREARINDLQTIYSKYVVKQ